MELKNEGSESWVGDYSPVTVFNLYCKRFGCSPKVFSFYLNGYGTLQMPQRNIFCMAGFSEKTLELMKILEQDRNALVNEIKKVIFN